jgi:mannose-6-phosphate isomerase-like protein (cupin superfamily)
MGTTDRSRVIRLAEAQAGIPGPAGERSVVVLQRGTLDVALGTPARPNEQTPHAQDEVYIVIRGRGVLFHNGKRDPFEAGDFLFVAAATEHRFEDFSDDLLVWRVFYGPRGGEVQA